MFSPAFVCLSKKKKILYYLNNPYVVKSFEIE